MARRDLTNEEIEAMSLDDPGSAADYLEARREELEAEKQAERDRDDEERWIARFVAAGGDRSEARSARKKLQNEQALEAARRADEAAIQQTRLHASRSL
jgi:hypothetical protein